MKILGKVFDIFKDTQRLFPDLINDFKNCLNGKNPKIFYLIKWPQGSRKVIHQYKKPSRALLLMYLNWNIIIEKIELLIFPLQ